MASSELTSELRERVISAIRSVRDKIRWKPGKEVAHLETRKDWKHLAETATLDDYHAIIQTVLQIDEARVYLYHHTDKIYPTVVADVEHRTWLVMFTLNGIMETAFVVEFPDEYLEKRQFVFIGELNEVLE